MGGQIARFQTHQGGGGGGGAAGFRGKDRMEMTH